MNKLVYILVIFISINAFSQGEANNWYFGENAGLDFNSGSPVAITNGQLNTREGCSSFSDSNGNLLFYSDGTTVWNRNHNPMPNGNGLAGDASSSQSAMIIPKPGSVTEYFIFTVGASSSDNAGFNYYTIDMTAAGRLGDVISGPINLTQGRAHQWTEKVAAVKGDECQTYWVVSYVEKEFYAYKVSTTGVATSPVRSSVIQTPSDRRGYLKISPDGKKIAIAHMADMAFYLYDFDDATGVVRNQRNLPLITPDNKPYGVEFSSNSEKLYVHASNDYWNQGDPSQNNIPTNHTSTLYQFDVSLPTTAEIVNSRTVIDSRNLYRGALQLGPDQKIYRALSETYNSGIAFLGVIENPENDGLACNYQHATVPLNARRSSQGLPPFIASIFSQIDLTSDDGNGSIKTLNDQTLSLCVGTDILINPEPLTGTATYNWYLNNSLTSFSNSTDLSFSNVTQAIDGRYKLIVEQTDVCGIVSILEGEFSIKVYNVPIANQAQDIIECDDDNNGTYPFDFKDQNDIIIGSQRNMEVLYFSSLLDAENNENEIPLIYESGSTTIFARIQAIGNSDCYDITSFNIDLFESAFPLDTSSIAILNTCDNNTIGTDTDGFVQIDLTQKQSEILNGQSDLDFTLTYFSDPNYINQINPSIYTNTISGGQTVYVRMTNNLNNSCYSDTSFILQVNSLPTIQSFLEFKNCDEDGNPDGFTDYNLDEANEIITNGDSTLAVTYYLSSTDANSGINQINPLPFNNQTASTVYARIENSDGCHRIATIDLKVSTTTFPPSYTQQLENCDDDAIIDGLHVFDLTLASPDIIAQFPLGQNLSVHYFRNLVDAQLEQNEILSQSDYFSEIPFNQTLYVRVESDDNGECFGIGPHLTLVVHPRPEFEVIPTEIVCLNLPPITLHVYNPKDLYNYTWTDESGNIISNDSIATVSSGGIYTVIATSGLNCKSFPQTITVSESIIADITIDDITITDDSENNTITINSENKNLGIGDYEFNLDEIEGIYQDEPSFENVAPGIHTIFIRDKNKCGVTAIEVSVIGYPKFFTPNNDGYNDYWQVKGVGENFYPTSLIYIFDRFGKIISKVDPTSQGWDGLFNGKQLPSSDYWFSVQLIGQNGEIREKRGHFSLIRK